MVGPRRRHEEQTFLDGRQGPSRKFKDLRFFACEGLVVIVDERETRKNEKGEIIEEGDIVVLLPKVFKQRVKEFLRTYRDRKYSEMTPYHKSTIAVWQKQLIGGLETAKEAKEMGDPSDPRVQAYWAKHHGKPYVSLRSLPTLDTIVNVGRQQSANVSILTGNGSLQSVGSVITQLPTIPTIDGEIRSQPLPDAPPKLILP